MKRNVTNLRLADIKKEVIDDQDGGQVPFQSSATPTTKTITGNHSSETNGRIKRQASHEVEYVLPHGRKSVTHANSMVSFTLD